jgi:hypothetical protein
LASSALSTPNRGDSAGSRIVSVMERAGLS